MDIINDREAKVKQLGDLEDIQDNEMLNALTQDNEAGVGQGGFVKGVISMGMSQMSESTAMSISQSATQQSANPDYNPDDFNLE